MRLFFKISMLKKSSNYSFNPINFPPFKAVVNTVVTYIIYSYLYTVSAIQRNLHMLNCNNNISLVLQTPKSVAYPPFFILTYVTSPRWRLCKRMNANYVKDGSLTFVPYSSFEGE